ncbi:hypothetical protein PG984_001543 [Apiospora sp. TS-2023a]
MGTRRNLGTRGQFRFTESSQTDSEMPDMLHVSGSVPLGQGLPEPGPSFSPQHDPPQVAGSGPDLVDADYLTSPDFHGLPLCPSAYQDEDHFYNLFNVGCDNADTQVKSSEVTDDIDDISKFTNLGTPPTPPGASPSTSKRKRSVDGDEEGSNVRTGIKRRCSESSR